jgi:hypothetical protein
MRGIIPRPNKERKMKSTVTLLIAAAALALATFPLHATVLYDGLAGTSPQAQGWLTFASILGATPTTAGGVTTLDTTGGGLNLEHAGFSNYTPAASLVNAGFPTLDSTAGFDLSFTIKLDTEAHATNDRAGFSVILLDQNHEGVELGFWSTEVWAQNDSPLFTHGEGNLSEGHTAYDPAAFHDYDLAISGANYALLSDGQLLLSGSTRDYSSFGVPYTLGNYVFFGDDTGSARGAVEISRIAVVPEPVCGMMAALGVSVVVRGRGRHRDAISA